MLKLVAALCSKLHHTSTFHPQTNSTVECVNGTLGQALLTFCNKQQNDWDYFLPSIMMAFRKAQSSTTDYTPYEMLFGRSMQMPSS